MKYLYQNWSTNIFQGFYESALYYSDTEYYINENLKDEPDYEPMEIDWIPYTQEVCSGAADLLADRCINDDKIIKSMSYHSLSSPRYYNFETDRLCIDTDINLTKLKAYIKQNKPDFELYLKDNFTSYDGFTSFISNNFNQFFEDYKDNAIDKDRCINTMLEYYILRQIYGDNWEGMKQTYFNSGEYYETPYHYELFDLNTEAQWKHLKPCTDTAA